MLEQSLRIEHWVVSEAAQGIFVVRGGITRLGLLFRRTDDRWRVTTIASTESCKRYSMRIVLFAVDLPLKDVPKKIPRLSGGMRSKKKTLLISAFVIANWDRYQHWLV